ncbi:MAG: DUF2283 domain-containing protein [Anaerolineales bacterium]|nr:DUF2283 domain-containing protein [Anaerolineales bacterium]
MRLKIDKENDALYFRLDETEIVESEEVQPGVILDFNKDNYVVGIEILDLSTRTTPEKLRVFQFETVWGLVRCPWSPLSLPALGVLRNPGYNLFIRGIS